jgi:hypothetical protein
MSIPGKGLWGRLQAKVGKSDSLSWPLAKPPSRADSITTGTSGSSQDSGYASALASECDDDASAIVIEGFGIIHPDGPPGDGNAHGDTTQPTRTAGTKAALPRQFPDANDSPINIETHRAVREIVRSFKQGFGRQLTRHLSLHQTSSKDPSTRAVAIFPRLARNEDGLATVDVAINVQCHPSAERQVHRFLKEHRTAINSSLLSIRTQQPDTLRIIIRVIGQEITFLSGPARVRTRHAVPGTSANELCGKVVEIEAGDGSVKECTLGGWVLLSDGPRSQLSFFGVSTAHGLQKPLQGNGTPESRTLLKLVLAVMKSLNNVCDRFRRRESSDDLFWLLIQCRNLVIEIARDMCLRHHINPDLGQNGCIFFQGFLDWLRRFPQGYLGIDERTFQNESEEYVSFVRTRLLPYLEALLRSSPAGRAGMFLWESFPGDPPETADDPDQLVGSLYLTSAELILDDDEGTYEDGNLDWALLEPSGDQAFTHYSLSWPLYSVFRPSISASDIDDCPKVILVNHKLGYPDAEISPQVAFISIPPSLEPVEVMILARDTIQTTPSATEPTELSPGDSGSWAISINQGGEKVVHGQLIGVSCLGDGLLMPMDKILADMTERLRPIFEPEKAEITTHLPLFALHLKDLPSEIREEQMRLFGREERLLVWKLRKLDWDTIRARWILAGQGLVFRTQEAAEQWELEGREWAKQALDWDPSVAIISNQWFEMWQQRISLWAVSISHWTQYKERRGVESYPPANTYDAAGGSALRFVEDTEAQEASSRNPVPAVPFARILGSLAKSGSSRATESYQSLWSHATSAATTGSSIGYLDPLHESHETGVWSGVPVGTCGDDLDNDKDNDKDNAKFPSRPSSPHSQSQLRSVSSAFSEARDIEIRPSSAVSSSYFNPTVSWKSRGFLHNQHGLEGPEIPATVIEESDTEDGFYKLLRAEMRKKDRKKGEKGADGGHDDNRKRLHSENSESKAQGKGGLFDLDDI